MRSVYFCFSYIVWNLCFSFLCFVVLYCYFLAAFSSLYVNDIRRIDSMQAAIRSMKVQSQPAISAT